MICCVEEQSDNILPFDAHALLQQVLEEGLARTRCPFEARAEVILTDDEGIREVNLAHRGKDRATDVLSFPAFTFPAPAAFDALVLNDTVRDPETGAVWIGDIILNQEAVLRQAEEYGHSAEREFAYLTVHALMHLIGHDHETKEEEELMRKAEEEVLCALKITRKQRP